MHSKALAWWRDSLSSYWRDISWVASGTVIAQAISLLSMPLLTRLYDPAAFASLSIFTQLAALAAVVLTLRFEYALPLPRRRLDAVALLWLVVALGAAGALLWTGVAALLAPQLAGMLSSESALLWLLAPLTGMLISLAVATQYFAQRQLNYRRIGIAEVGNKVVYLLTALLGLWLLPSPAGLLLAVGAGALGKTLLLASPDSLERWRGRRRRARAWARLLLRNAARYRGLSASMVGSHLMLTLTGLIPSLYVAQAFGADTLGQMALVISTTYLPSALIGAAVGQVYFQRAAQRWAQGQDFAELWRITARKLALIGLPIYAGLALVAPWVYPIVFGAQWQLAGQFASIMSLSAYLSFLTTPLDRSCIVAGAWRYIPLWHFGRLASTVAVVALSRWLDWSATTFIIALTLQMSLLYLIDFFAERAFASMRNSGARS